MQEQLERLGSAARRFLTANLLVDVGFSWEQHVLANLSPTQTRLAHDHHWQSVDDLDLAALLQVIDRNWDLFRRKGELEYESRHWLKEALTIRNRWAHSSGKPVEPSVRYRDLDTLTRLTEALGATADAKAIAEARDSIFNTGGTGRGSGDADLVSIQPRERPVVGTRRAPTAADGHDTHRVESAIRRAIEPGEMLSTPTGRGRFEVARLTEESLVLLLGEKRAWTPLSWNALEGVPELLRGRGWVRVGGTYTTESAEGTLDAYLKGFLKRATAGWVAVVLEQSGVVAIDRGAPARVRLNDGW